MQLRLLDREALAARGIKYSRVHLYRLIAAKKFPKPVKLGSRNLWPANEIDAYLESLIAKRDGAAA
jgi:prophage regulatory protein